MQAQRFFVEHCIKENKQILGMDEYQTRKWGAASNFAQLFTVGFCPEGKIALF